MEYEKSFKRKMLLWTSNWLNQEDPHPEEEVPLTPDAVEIARILVATGYRVRFMDRCLPNEMCPVTEVPAGSPACRVIIMCPHSGLRMELEAATSSCNCPPLPYGLDKSWTVGEPGSERMEEAVEFTIARANQEISKSVSQFIAGLLRVTSKFSNVNQTDEVKVNTESTVVSMTEVQEALTQSVKSDCVSSVKTPATAGITVVTPSAPCIPKASPSDGKTAIPGRYRSLDTLIGSGAFVDDLPEPGQLTPKEDGRAGPEMAMDVDADPDATIVEGPPSGHKKFISKSSPAVNYTEQFQRSDTFVFEEPEGGEKNVRPERTLTRSGTYCLKDGAASDAEKGPRLGPPPSRTPSPLPPVFSQSLLLNKLQDIQRVVSDIIVLVAGNDQVPSSIGDVSKASKAILNAVQQRVSDNVRPIRCLSDFGSVPNLARDGTTSRSIARPQMRRYATTLAAPATPTSSRRDGASLSKRASTTALSSPAGTVGKTQTTSRGGANRLAAPASGRPTATSPGSTGATTKTRKLTPVRKYANVQSSIPKPSSARK